jgi:hypothetical protein
VGISKTAIIALTRREMSPFLIFNSYLRFDFLADWPWSAHKVGGATRGTLKNRGAESNYSYSANSEISG